MEIGLVLTIIDGVARAILLEYTFIGELVKLTNVSAVTLNLEIYISGLTVLGNDRNVEQGDVVERTFAELLICVGFHLLGRIIDAAGYYLD